MKTINCKRLEWLKYIIVIIAINIIFMSGIILEDGIIIQRDFNFPIFNDNFITYSTSIWNDYTSQPNIEQVVRLFIRLPFIILSYVGIEMGTILKLMILTTYVFVTISMFILINEIFKRLDFDNKNVALICALLFAYNPISLQFSWAISLLFSLGVLPLLLYIILKYQETDNKKFIVLFPMLLLLSTGHPFILIMNILISFIFSLYIFGSDIMNTSKILNITKQYIFIGIIFLLISLWFIIPYITMNVSSIDTGRSQNIDRNTFEDISENDMYKILILERDKFVIVNTFPIKESDKIIHVLSLVSILLVSFLVPLFNVRTVEEFIKRLLLFVSTGYIISSLLSLGANSPIGELYWYAVSSTPIGWIVRSPLKFQLYQSFFLILLFTLGISILLKRYNFLDNHYILFVLIAIFAGTSIYGITDANLNSLNPITIPRQYFEINDILEKENNDYKVIWYPKYDELNTTWSNGHRIAPFDMKSSRRATFSTEWNYNFVNYYLNDFPYTSNLFEKSRYYDYLLSIGIKYIAFHDDMNRPIDYKVLNNIRNHSENIYNKDGWYLFEIKGKPSNIIDSYDEIMLMENENPYKGALPGRALINKDDLDKIKNKESIGSKYKRDTNIDYVKIEPMMWNVKVNTSGPFLLSFSETYDKLWEATIYKDGKKIRTVEPIPVYSVINGFWIDETGKDINIEIRYKPQKWFNIGMLISIFVLITCIGYILYYQKR